MFAERGGFIAAVLTYMLALATLGTPAELSAQQSQEGLRSLESRPQAAEPERRHQGFWFGFGAGAGRWMVDYRCNPDFGPCDDPRDGLTFQMRMGTAVSEQFLIGIEFLKWCRSGGGGCSNATAENLTLNAIVFPIRGSGAFFEVGAGVGASSSEWAQGLRVGTTLGAGYDIRLAGDLHISPIAQLMLHQGRERWLLLGAGLTKY